MESVPARTARLSAAVLAALGAAGCLDQSPGGSQQQGQALRAESVSPGRPECRDETLLLILDEDALAPGKEPNRFSERDLGCHRKRVGNRATLDWFARNIGSELVLPSGSVGDEGWFAPTAVRIAWKSAGPEAGDGLRNYLESGPGLGGPDAMGNRESLLENVPGLVPLRATGLTRLEGRSVCAVVLGGDVRMSYSPLAGNIRGENLGKVAFQILSVEGGGYRHGSQSLPRVKARILDAEAVCSDPLALFADAPVPRSNCEPRDAERPACAVQRAHIDEPWNGFDTTVWVGDGDQAVDGGLLFSRDGAFSTAADWIPKCPLPVDSNTGIRFSNRVRMIEPVGNDFHETGALFMVNAEGDGGFSDYVFVNVGYTGQPGKVFVELFGSSGGQDFDQYEESSLATAPSLNFSVDLWIFRDSYQVAIGGEAIDTVLLPKPLAAMALFEVGVQQNGDGLRGLVDHTSIGTLCKAEKERIHRCRRHTERRMCFRKGRSYASPQAAEPEPEQASTRAVGHIRGRNKLIRMARAKVRGLAKPPVGLMMLSKMKEIPDPTQY